MLLLNFLLGCAAPEADIIEKPNTVIVYEETCATLLGRQICDFNAIDENGEEAYLSDLYGQPIVLDLSAMWCAPCVAAGRETQSKADLLPDVHFLTILIEDTQGNPPDANDIESWKQTTGISSEPVWGASRDILTSDPLQMEAHLYLTGWPTFYFIDSHGRLIEYQRGYDYDLIFNKASTLQ